MQKMFCLTDNYLTTKILKNKVSLKNYKKN